MTQSGQRLTVLKNVGQTGRTPQNMLGKPIMKVSPIIASSSHLSQQQSGGSVSISQPLAAAIVHQWKNQTNIIPSTTTVAATATSDVVQPKIVESEFYLAAKEEQKKERRNQKLHVLNKINDRKCDATPIYGADLRDSLSSIMTKCNNYENTSWFTRSHTNCYTAMTENDENWCLTKMIKSYQERTIDMKSIFNNFVIFVPAVTAPIVRLHISHPTPTKMNEELVYENKIQQYLSPKMVLLHPIISAMRTQVNIMIIMLVY